MQSVNLSTPGGFPMSARFYPWFVLVFWLTTMSWLVVTKVLPPLLGGHPPDYTAALSERAAKEPPICWRISWNDKRIGTAVSQTIPRAEGGTALRHVVHFDRLPLDAMLSEGFGLVSSVIKPLVGSDSNLEMEMLLATELRFDSARQFTSFQTVADLGDLQNFIRLNGVMQPNHVLKLTTRWQSVVPGKSDPVMNHEIQLPRESLISDGFAPRPELKNLSVGQKWTIPVYRPFPPNSPIQIVEAVAKRLDVIVWDGRDTETILVEYREEAGSGIYTSREPIAREWIRADGALVQQEMNISGLTVRFERLTQTAAIDELDLLDSETNERLWKEHHP